MMIATHHIRIFFLSFILFASGAFISHLSAQTMYWDPSGVPICTADDWQRKPLAVSDGAKGAVVAWEDLRYGGKAALFAARLTVDGATPWTKDGVELTGPESSQSLGAVVSDGDGGLIAVYWNRKNGNFDVFAQRVDKNGNVKWGAGGTPVVEADGNQDWAVAAADGAGGVYVVWHDRRGADRDIYAQHLDANGTILWDENGILICGEPEDQSYPTVAANPLGGMYTAWMDKRDEDDIYAQYVSAAGELRWQPDFVVSNEPNRQIAPKMLAFRDSSVAILWQDFRGIDNTAAVYLQIVGPSGIPTYPNGYPLSQSPTPQTGLYLADDGQKGLIAVWTDFRKGTGEGDVFYRRVDSSGTVAGSDFGDALCSATGSQELPAVVADPGGGTFAVWQDNRNGNDYDLYMNRASPTGLTIYDEWNQNLALPLIEEDLGQLGPQVVASGLGAAIVIWYDGRIQDGLADIYAQRIAYAPYMAAPQSVDFGIVNPGNTVYDTVAFTNSGTVPLMVGKNVRRVRAAGAGAGDNSFLDFTVETVFDDDFIVPPDSTFHVVISFKPATGGLYQGDLQLRSNNSADPLYVRLEGTGYDPKIETRTVYNLPVAKMKKHTDTVLAGFIKNVGYGFIEITSIEMEGEDAVEFDLLNLPEFPFRIPTGGQFDLHLEFHPVFADAKDLTIRVRNNTPTPEKVTHIYAEATYAKLRANPFRIDFGTVLPMTSDGKFLTVSNGGEVLLKVGDVTVEGTDAQYFVLESTGNYELEPADYERFRIWFTPDSLREYSAKIIINSDDKDSPEVVDVMGIGGIPSAVSRLAVATGMRLEQSVPNPVSVSQHASAAISVDAGSASGTYTFSVYDMLGREVAAVPVAVHPGSTAVVRLPLDVHGIVPGMYAYTLHGSGGSLPSRTMIVVK